MKKITVCILLYLTSLVSAQVYPPPAGTAGSTAMHKDSSAFVAWASSCNIKRGYIDISDPASGYASAGDSTMATGKAQLNGAVSLGDGGFATCQFPVAITDGPGPDFAVFENGFDDTFLELAFVEVSSDGINFFRFPSHSLTDTITQTSSFGPTDATKINNLAGKYRGGYGVPFDLQDLSNNQQLDKGKILFVRITDVVGSLSQSFATRDSHHNKINDPWPTPFPSSGFDLDAVGIINQSIVSSLLEPESAEVISYPNPVALNSRLYTGRSNAITIITDLTGKEVFRSEQPDFILKEIGPGTYIVRTVSGNLVNTRRLIVVSQ